MSDHGAPPVRGRGWQAWISLACTVLMVLALLFLALKQTSNKHDEQQKNDVLQDTSLNLAEQVKRACSAGGETAKALGSACGQANAIVTQPQIQKGERGIQGRPGLPGPQGTDGKVGPRGQTGARGSAGAAGAKGEPGAVGAPGAPGEAGPAGPQGEAGPPGAAGADGQDGKPGADGKDAVAPASATCTPNADATFTCVFNPPS